MGIQMMGSRGSGQQSHQFQPLARHNSWFNLTLDEVENQLGNLGKPLGSMNLDELLKSVWMAEASQSTADNENASPTTSLQRQASLTLARAFSGKTVGEVWKDIQQGQKIGNFAEVNDEQRKSTLGEMTLEDFLVKAGIFLADASLGNHMELDNALAPQNFTPQMALSSSPSIDALSDTPVSGRKRGPVDLEKTLERKLRRKIKNRESAARSRARKQAYHNELVSKVSRLEEENMKLKKEKFMIFGSKPPFPPSWDEKEKYKVCKRSSMRRLLHHQIKLGYTKEIYRRGITRMEIFFPIFSALLLSVFLDVSWDKNESLCVIDFV